MTTETKSPHAIVEEQIELAEDFIREIILAQCDTQNYYDIVELTKDFVEVENVERWPAWKFPADLKGWINGHRYRAWTTDLDVDDDEEVVATVWYDIELI